MDEPTNHLDRATREKLYHYIQTSGSLILLVSHDRTLLNLVERTFELTHNKGEVYGGNYDFYKMCKQEKNQALLEQISEKEKEFRKVKNIARESFERQQKHSTRGEKRNVKKGIPKIRLNSLQSKSENSMAKLKGIHSGKQDNVLNEIKELQNNLPIKNDILLNFQNTKLHTGKILIQAKGINYDYGNKFLWKSASDIEVRSGERISISGKNGSGKTTLINMLLGVLQPTVGEVFRTDFSYVYIDQEYSIIDNTLTVYEQVEKYNIQHLPEDKLKILLHRFLFPYNTWDKVCSKLSGGEKMKLALCCLQVRNNVPDLFILDEPTNNLDITNIDVLTSVIKSFEGTLLVISHDSQFLKEVGMQRDICLDNFI